MYDIHSFVKEHRNDNLYELALRAHAFSASDWQWILRQIDGWQRAKHKLPLWAQTDGVEYPLRLSMEQCSSELTARYKAELVGGGERMTDLTAGFGVDAAVLAERYEYLTFVERNEQLCNLAQKNLPLLGVKSFEVVCQTAEEALKTLPHQNLIFLDPARRDEHGGRVTAIADCSPDVSLLNDDLLSKADVVLLKLSPMLDVRSVERDLHGVSDLHIVSVDGECKELLVRLSKEPTVLRTVCVNLLSNGKRQMLAFTKNDEAGAECSYTAEVGRYLYEPNASIMKAGCFRTVAQRYGLRKLHPNSHLYTSFADEVILDFPGRSFKVLGSSTFSKNAVKTLLSGKEKANLTVRNFPMSVDELRKKLKLREGGDLYLFATTLADESKVLISSSSSF